MTDHNDLHSIKTVAKRIARAKRIAHHEALDIVAGRLDYPHWNALTVAWGKGWRPTSTQKDAIEGLCTAANPVKPATGSDFDFASEDHGFIDGHEYALSIDLDGVLMHGRGWAIHVGEAPSENPEIEITDRRIKANPISHPEFVTKALEVVNGAAEKLRARIASDWPRRSTKPDAEGRTVHPLWSDSKPSREWYCLHCDGAFMGEQVAANMWHCPNCSATPIDIFATPFWRDDS